MFWEIISPAAECQLKELPWLCQFQCWKQMTPDKTKPPSHSHSPCTSSNWQEISPYTILFLSTIFLFIFVILLMLSFLANGHGSLWHEQTTCFLHFLVYSIMGLWSPLSIFLWLTVQKEELWFPWERKKNRREIKLFFSHFSPFLPTPQDEI